MEYVHGPIIQSKEHVKPAFYIFILINQLLLKFYTFYHLASPQKNKGLNNFCFILFDWKFGCGTGQNNTLYNKDIIV
jgi:hypothetical protein